MERFGEKLRALREHKQIRLVDLASEFGFKSHTYLSEIETGKKLPTLEIVMKVSSYFTISTDELLKDEMEVAGLTESDSREG